jgi:predicted Zn-dependent protease with MMP-like domain|tara:strand:+ start:144 stop:323 length:180 start_codon:yes stop_codon:yes gene_type:complete
MNNKPFLKPYTVYYRDFQNLRLENCFYALDAYEARTLAMEFNKYINAHPNSIDLIRCEK